MITIRPQSDAERELWRLTRRVTELLAGIPWVLIGGQMVAILEFEHGRRVLYATRDVDSLVDVRASSSAAEAAARRLIDAGFEPETCDGNLAYRFTREGDIVDVLAPDNLGKRSNLTTLPPNVTIETVGGTQALRRARNLAVQIDGSAFEIPVPTLAGAIVIKARAATSADASRPKHERDLARLLALVTSPASVRDELTGRERGYLRAHRGLNDESHPAWGQISGAEDALLAFRIITE